MYYSARLDGCTCCIDCPLPLSLNETTVPSTGLLVAWDQLSQTAVVVGEPARAPGIQEHH